MDSAPARCIASIGPQERARRLRFGIGAFSVSVGLAVALIVIGAPRGWRLTLFALLLIAALGFFQARDKT
jgi:hypothetical protein